MKRVFVDCLLLILFLSIMALPFGAITFSKVSTSQVLGNQSVRQSKPGSTRVIVKNQLTDIQETSQTTF